MWTNSSCFHSYFDQFSTVMSSKPLRLEGILAIMLIFSSLHRRTDSDWAAPVLLVEITRRNSGGFVKLKGYIIICCLIIYTWLLNCNQSKTFFHHRALRQNKEKRNIVLIYWMTRKKGTYLQALQRKGFLFVCRNFDIF